MLLKRPRFGPVGKDYYTGNHSQKREKHESQISCFIPCGKDLVKKSEEWQRVKVFYINHEFYFIFGLGLLLYRNYPNNLIGFWECQVILLAKL